MSHSLLANITLSYRHGSLLNCLGIQPLFVDNGFIPSSFLGYTYRVATYVKPQGTMKYDIRYKLGHDNDYILKDKFHISSATKEVVNTLLNNSFTLKHNVPLDELMMNKPLLKETMLYYMERIKYYISIGKGNFLITSRQDLYYEPLFLSSEVKNYMPYLVDENILPRNIVIIGHKNSITYGNPLVACPLIDKNHFDQLCEMNGIDIDNMTMLQSKNQNYPMIEKYLNLYSLYQSYLDNVDVPYWHIENFEQKGTARQKAYYTTLYFD